MLAFYFLLKNMSLIKKIESGEFPEEQFIDAETLQWIKDNEPEFNIEKIDKEIFNYEKIISSIDRFFIKEGWFSKKEIVNTIHGIRHMMRVLVYALLVSDYLKLDEKTKQKLCIASVIHDLRRLNDNADYLHGHRAADWFMENKEEVLKCFNLEMPPQDIEEIYFIIFFHAQDTKTISNNSDYLKYQKSIDIFKTLDALDRYRLPKLKWWINEDYLIFKPPIFSKEIAYKLVVNTEEQFLSSNDNKNCIKQAISLIHDQYDF